MDLNVITDSKKLKIHIISETPFVMKGQGVHTAFVDHVNLLREANDVEVVVNQEATGDVLHSHTYGPYYFLKARHYKHRTVFTVHVIPDSIKGSLPFWKFFYPFITWYFKHVYNRASVCIAISPMVEKVLNDLNVHSKIVRIDNPLPVNTWKRTPANRTEGRRRLGLSENVKVVLGVGQLQQRKGVEDFLDIAEAIPEAIFVWVGGRPFGKLTEGIKRLDKRMEQVSSHIHFTGLLDLADMPYMYAAADIFLFPSYQENCPLAPIEAAASGIPVVFRDLLEYQLLYTHTYLKAATTQQFIEITRQLLNNPNYYNQSCQISAQLISQFDKDRIREQFIHLYNNLVDT